MLFDTRTVGYLWPPTLRNCPLILLYAQGRRSDEVLALFDKITLFFRLPTVREPFVDHLPRPVTAENDKSSARLHDRRGISMSLWCLCVVTNGQAFDRSSEHLVAKQVKCKLPPSRRDGDVRCVTSLANGNEPMSPKDLTVSDTNVPLDNYHQAYLKRRRMLTLSQAYTSTLIGLLATGLKI